MVEPHFDIPILGQRQDKSKNIFFKIKICIFLSVYLYCFMLNGNAVQS